MRQYEKITDENFAPRGGTGHGWDFSKDGSEIVKLNKHGREVCSLIEFFASQVIHLLLPELTPDINLVQKEIAPGTNQHQIVGVAVERKEGFMDFSRVNLIRIIADIEREENSKDGAKHFATYQPNEIKPEELDKIKKYFTHEDCGKGRRVEFLREYYLTVIIRNILQEDDQHKGNVGFHWRERRGEKNSICPFTIDFDMMFQQAIGANFNMVRRSQWGSPFGKYKITFRDIVNSPFIRDSNPGHNPAIEANAFGSNSITLNAGRYTSADVEALRYLSSLEVYDQSRKTAIYLALDKILELDLVALEKNFHQYNPTVLEKFRGVQFKRDSQCNFPHIFAVEVAKIQLQIYKVLKEAEEYKEDPDFANALLKTRSRFEEKFEDYASKKKFNELRVGLLNKYNGDIKGDVVAQFKQDVAKLESDLYLHFYVKDMKNFTIELCELVARKCDLDQLTELVNWWDNISEGYILKARESNWISRVCKNYFFNRNVTTYVTMRDIMVKRALELRSQKNNIQDIMNTLMRHDSILDSHSERPISFLIRLRLEYIRLFYDDYGATGFWGNYARAKKGWEAFLFKSVILTPIVLAKDCVKFLVEFIPFILQCVVRLPRRWAADGMRYLYKNKGNDLTQLFRYIAWLVCATNYIVFTLLQISTKLIGYVGGKITSPLLSAERESKWVYHILKALGASEGAAQVAKKIMCCLSLMTSAVLIFACTKVLTTFMVISTTFLNFVALYHVFSFFATSVGQLAICATGVASMIFQAITDQLFQKIDKENKPVGEEKPSPYHQAYQPGYVDGLKAQGVFGTQGEEKGTQTDACLPQCVAHTGLDYVSR